MKKIISDFGSFDNCTGIITDGAQAMVGIHTGLVGNLRQIGLKCLFIHCIIHQEALCDKFVKINETMKKVISIVNFIRGGNKAQIHRAFIKFLEEMESEYGDIPLHCEVRWLSAENCLKSFFELRSEVFEFLKSKNIGQQFYEDLQSISFMKSLAFHTDLTSHLNILNLKLQGRGQNICQLFSYIEGFRKKLEVFKNALGNNDTTYFPSCQEIKKIENQSVCFIEFKNIITELISEFNSRFKDFYILKPKFELFNNPMTVDISLQPPDFQMELCDLQADCFLQSKVNLPPEEFWKLCSQEKFPTLRNFSLEILSLFGSTYISELAFSTMNLIKSKSRNRIHDSSLESCIRLATTGCSIEIVKLATEKQCQSSH